MNFKPETGHNPRVINFTSPDDPVRNGAKDLLDELAENIDAAGEAANNITIGMCILGSVEGMRRVQGCPHCLRISAFKMRETADTIEAVAKWLEKHGK